MINEIITGNNVEIMETMPADYIDLTVTSPPYDNLRDYKGYSFDFENVVKELYRVTKPGGVVVWVVSDATKNGSESGTSFKQALYFMEIGFNLHDTMIWTKTGGGAIGSNKTYTQNFEYMFIFSKGKIKTFNLIKDVLNKSYVENADSKVVQGRRRKDGTLKTETRKPPSKYSKRNNYWYVAPQKSFKTDGKDHPAVFPEQLASDHILTWSNENEIVFDPFGGSGTTAKMAKVNKRKYIHLDVSQEYNELAKKRLTETKEKIIEKENQTDIFDFLK